MRQVAMLVGGQIEPVAIFLGNQIGLMLYYEAMGESVFLDKYWKCSINIDQDPLKIFNFFVKNRYLTPLKKLIKFTRISRNVRTFAKKTEISQNTENFHPCEAAM